MKNDGIQNNDASSASDSEKEQKFNNEFKKAFSKALSLESEMKKNMDQEEYFECASHPNQNCCHVKLDTIHKLKDSTRKLLHILEQIQAKTRKKFRICDDSITSNGVMQPKSLFGNSVSSGNLCNPTLVLPFFGHRLLKMSSSNLSVSDVVARDALFRLELQTRVMQNINVENEDDDCSVYKRLTRKCHCLNNTLYNDFVIHFNENTKYTTNNIGEIVKNMRILRKFLYMGGNYTKNALMFLNEGLTQSKLQEKIEIMQGCAHADICNIFEEHSIVTVCISWPCKVDYYGDAITQAWTANLLHKLAELEDGRRYLNYNAKITNDIKKVLRKRGSQLEAETIDTLNDVINLLTPIFVKNPNVTYICQTANEGIGSRTIKDLVESREHMTLDEIFMHLDLLRNFSKLDFGKEEILINLPALLLLFKDLLIEYDNSEMNIMIMNMLSNLVSTQILKRDEKSTKAIADAATEPIKKKNEGIQMPPKKNSKKIPKSKGLGVSPVRLMNNSKRRVSDWERSSNFVNRSKKFSKDLRNSIIVVPIE